MRAIIVGGGDCPKKSLIEKYMINDYIILAADSGADILCKYDITPDYLLGDFDSINQINLKKLVDNTNTTRLPVEKDYTDTHVAVLKAMELGANEIILLGCTGKRIDHFIANLCLLKLGIDKEISIYMVDDYNEIFLINKSTCINGRKGQTFSLFSYCEDTVDLTIRGAKYRLENFYLKQGNNLTVSNEFVNETVDISFSKGLLLVFKIN